MAKCCKIMIPLWKQVKSEECCVQINEKECQRIGVFRCLENDKRDFLVFSPKIIHTSTLI